jgi:hypothetical protein
VWRARFGRGSEGLLASPRHSVKVRYRALALADIDAIFNYLRHERRDRACACGGVAPAGEVGSSAIAQCVSS